MNMIVNNKISKISIHQAAILYKDGIWSLPRPARHHHIINHMATCLGLDHIPYSDMVQGFVDGHGEFFNREQAAKRALRILQVKELKAPPDLYSEELW